MTYKLAILDYGLGNLHSVHKAFQQVAKEVEQDWQVEVVRDSESMLRADKIVFPGVGAIRDCMGGLEKLGLRTALETVLKTKPLLAICVGMQALMSCSEENGGVDCLNWIPGSVLHFPEGQQLQGMSEKKDGREAGKLKVPHMGWNQVTQFNHFIWQDIPDLSRFYFVHSYYVPENQKVPVLGTCHYGVDFSAAMGKDNWVAVQFHPEKSHLHGLQLLKNFLNWNP